MKAYPVTRKAIGIGIALGLVFGVAIHNFALGILIGVAIGTAFVVRKCAQQLNKGEHRG